MHSLHLGSVSWNGCGNKPCSGRRCLWLCLPQHPLFLGYMGKSKRSKRTWTLSPLSILVFSAPVCLSSNTAWSERGALPLAFPMQLLGNTRWRSKQKDKETWFNSQDSLKSFGGSYSTVLFLWFGLRYKMLLTKQCDTPVITRMLKKALVADAHMVGGKSACCLGSLLSGEEV